MLQYYFDLCFTVTNDVNDYVLASVFLNFALCVDVTLKQLKRTVLANLESVRKKIKGKQVKVYCGMKLNKKEEVHQL